ncbi:hypothetical protein D3C72_808360 [compost metagenome]
MAGVGAEEHQRDAAELVVAEVGLADPAALFLLEEAEAHHVGRDLHRHVHEGNLQVQHALERLGLEGAVLHDVAVDDRRAQVEGDFFLVADEAGALGLGRELEARVLEVGAGGRHLEIELGQDGHGALTDHLRADLERQRVAAGQIEVRRDVQRPAQHQPAEAAVLGREVGEPVELVPAVRGQDHALAGDHHQGLVDEGDVVHRQIVGRGHGVAHGRLRGEGQRRGRGGQIAALPDGLDAVVEVP